MVGAVAYPEGDSPRKTRILTRSAAVPGDRIAVTGSLGCSAGGLRMMQDGLSFDARTLAHLANAHNRPVPRVPQGMLLARRGVVAAIDVSDGLVDDLGKLCRASNLSATVKANDVPVDAALKAAFPDDWLRLATYGGEDYELLFTARGSIMSRIPRLMQTPVTVIGEISEINEIKGGPTGVSVLDEAGATMTVGAGGWDHFASPQDSRPGP